MILPAIPNVAHLEQNNCSRGRTVEDVKLSDAARARQLSNFTDVALEHFAANRNGATDQHSATDAYLNSWICELGELTAAADALQLFVDCLVELFQLLVGGHLLLRSLHGARRRLPVTHRSFLLTAGLRQSTAPTP
jgi:hypothetical protein